MQREEVVGADLWTMFPAVRGTEAERLYRSAMDLRVPMEGENYYEPARTWFELRVWPHEEGGIVILSRDVTARKESEVALRAALAQAEERRLQLAVREEQLRLATEAAEVGLWDVDPVSDNLFWPPRVKAMFGISPDAPVSMERDFFPCLHEDDREHVSQQFSRAMDPVERALYDVEYRTIGKEDGVHRWVAAKGRGIFDESGQCVRVLGVAIDITKRKRAEEAMLRADRHKNDFIATLSHELRNPLSPLTASVHLLRRSAAIDDAGRRVVDVMDRQLRHLVRLVDDLMDLSRVSQGFFELRMEHLRVRDVLDAAVEQIEPAMREREHCFSVEHGLDDQAVRGDKVRLTQLIVNLLTNASKYTSNGGTIRLRAMGHASEVLVEVVDNGQGFNPEKGEEIFQIFSRGSNSTGLGIGLALSRSIAALHSGQLTAFSAGVGSGATFTLRLPLIAQTSIS